MKKERISLSNTFCEIFLILFTGIVLISHVSLSASDVEIKEFILFVNTITFTLTFFRLFSLAKEVFPCKFTEWLRTNAFLISFNLVLWLSVLRGVV
jgi:hypothetical protein